MGFLRPNVQCHNLPNPAMHEAAKWPGIVERMVLRMQGKGNMGTLMADMMDLKYSMRRVATLKGVTRARESIRAMTMASV